VDNQLHWRDANPVDVPVYAGVMVLANATMARCLAADIPDIEVPGWLADRVAADKMVGVEAACQAAAVRLATLNGAVLGVAGAGRGGRLELPPLAAENTLVVDADFGYVLAGAGLHRVAGPDGCACVYSKAFPGGAPRIYCCFDEAGLRAPFTVCVNAPAGWSCLANAPVVSHPGDGDAGWWRFAATPPISPYLSSFCAGPFSGPVFACERGDGPPVPVTAGVLPSAAPGLEAAVSPELVGHPLAYYERSLGTPYPYGKGDFVFVPGYPWPGLRGARPGHHHDLPQPVSAGRTPPGCHSMER
jgi:aminopeptidase N